MVARSRTGSPVAARKRPLATMVYVARNAKIATNRTREAAGSGSKSMGSNARRRKAESPTSPPPSEGWGGGCAPMREPP